VKVRFIWATGYVEYREVDRPWPLFEIPSRLEQNVDWLNRFEQEVPPPTLRLAQFELQRFTDGSIQYVELGSTTDQPCGTVVHEQ
jgi:hypothetical protein